MGHGAQNPYDDEDARAVGRRRWLGALVPLATDVGAQVVHAHLDHTLPPRRRPPGARPEPAFLALCDACGECIDACLHGAVFRIVDRGQAEGGTPVMRPDLGACHLCADFPCAMACDRGALLREEANGWRMGTVRVREDRCIEMLGPECGACARLCPEGARGALVAGDGGPWVDPDRCNGCGKCIAACPTTPPAIELVPLGRR